MCVCVGERARESVCVCWVESTRNSPNWKNHWHISGRSAAEPAIICAHAAQREETLAFLRFRSCRSPLFSMMCALLFFALTRPVARSEPARHVIPLRNKESPLTFPDPHQQLVSFRSAEKRSRWSRFWVEEERHGGLMASCESVIKKL